MKKLIYILTLLAVLSGSQSQVLANGNNDDCCERECREEGRWCCACNVYHSAEEWERCHCNQKHNGHNEHNNHKE